MTTDTTGVDRALGAIGTTFRLTRLYPPPPPPLPGMTADHVLALFQVATGTAAPDAQALGRITITLGRRSAARLERTRPPTPAEGVPAIVDPASGGVPAAAAPAPETRAAAAADTLMSAKR